MGKKKRYLQFLFKHSFNLGSSDALMFKKPNNKPGYTYHNDCVAAHGVVKILVLNKCVKDQCIIYKHANAMVTGTLCDLKQNCVGGSVHTLMS